MKEILFRKTVEGIPNDDSEHSTYDSNSGDHLNLVHYETCPEMQLVRHFRYAQFRPDYERGVMSALTNNRITSHFEANTAKLICNNCFILLESLILD